MTESWPADAVTDVTDQAGRSQNLTRAAAGVGEVGALIIDSWMEITIRDMRNLTSKSPQIIGIDLLRLCAATLVIFYHFGFWHWTDGQTVLPRAFADGLPGGAVFHFGWVGVEIFFVLSGFVIAYSAQGVSCAKFARSRLLRLAPTAWVCATVSFVVFGCLMDQQGARLLLDYMATLVFWPFRAVDAVYWTLGMEIAFYTLVFFLIRAGKLTRLEPLMVGIGLLGGVFWIAALTLANVLEHSAGSLATLHLLVLKAEGNRLLQLLLVQHGCLFSFGVVLQRASVEGITRWRIAALAALTVACLLEIVGQNTIIERGAHVSLSPVPAIAAWLVAVTSLAGAVVWNESLLGLLGRHADLVRLCGKITYPLYLIHNTVVFASVILLGPLLGIDSILAGIILAFVSAVIIERLPERWLRRWLSKLLPHSTFGHAHDWSRQTCPSTSERHLPIEGLPANDPDVYVHAAVARPPR